MSHGLLPVLESVCSELGQEVSAAQLRQLIQFRQDLYEANTVKNFTRVPIVDCDARHFAESALILDLIPQGAKVLDIGSGPGFPSYVLAVLRPDVEVTAVDSNGKMIGFLAERYQRNLKTVHARMESLKFVEEFDLVTGRAVAPLPIQLELSAKACKMLGRVIPFRSVNELIEDSYVGKLGLRHVVTLIRNVTDDKATRAFPIFEKIEQTPSKYPRAWGSIKKSPLG